MSDCRKCFWLEYCQVGFATALAGECRFDPVAYVPAKQKGEILLASPPAYAEVPFVQAVLGNLVSSVISVRRIVSGTAAMLDQDEDQLRLAERYLIVDALQQCGWHQAKAAARLGISPRVLNYKVLVLYRMQHPSWRNWSED